MARDFARGHESPAAAESERDRELVGKVRIDRALALQELEEAAGCAVPERLGACPTLAEKAEGGAASLEDRLQQEV
jgi:hypothetical protein